jgi:hypothetical protein
VGIDKTRILSPTRPRAPLLATTTIQSCSRNQTTVLWPILGLNLNINCQPTRLPAASANVPSRFRMHPCLNVDEILRLVTCQLIELGGKATAVSLACCCRSFGDLVLDALWETQNRLTPLLKCFPQEVWRQEDGSFVSQLAITVHPLLKCLFPQSFQRIPTKLEWSNFQKYTRRVKNLEVFPSTDHLTPEILLALQFRTVNEPFLPRLKKFECKEPTEAFIPFIPFFLSPKTTNIEVTFGSDTAFAGSAVPPRGGATNSLRRILEPQEPEKRSPYN